MCAVRCLLTSEGLTGISNMLSQMQVDESVVPVLEHIETPAWIAQSIRQQLGETYVFIRRNVIVDENRPRTRI